MSTFLVLVLYKTSTLSTLQACLPLPFFFIFGWNILMQNFMFVWWFSSTEISTFWYSFSTKLRNHQLYRNVCHYLFSSSLVETCSCQISCSCDDFKVLKSVLFSTRSLQNFETISFTGIFAITFSLHLWLKHAHAKFHVRVIVFKYWNQYLLVLVLYKPSKLSTSLSSLSLLFLSIFGWDMPMPNFMLVRWFQSTEISTF